jgi:hypothetical protein
MATPAFVDQFKGYVERWVSRQQSQVAPAPADPKGPGRPCELPSEILWSRLLLCVLHRARGVRDVWRALVCQGYDLCDEAVYARLDSGGTEPLQALFAQLIPTCVPSGIIEEPMKGGRKPVLGTRVTRAAAHFPVEEVKRRMKMDPRSWVRERWGIIYHALINPRKAAEIARDTGVSVTTVRRVISRYNRVATCRD